MTSWVTFILAFDLLSVIVSAVNGVDWRICAFIYVMAVENNAHFVCGICHVIRPDIHRDSVANIYLQPRSLHVEVVSWLVG